MRFFATLPLCLGLMAAPCFSAEQPNPKGGGGRAPVAKPPRQQPQPRPAAGQGRSNQNPGQQREAPIDRLMKMTPEQREKALSRLAPERRQALEQRLGELQKLSPSARTRLMTAAEMLRSLPPERQGQVRQALRRFQEMPEERHAVVQSEMLNMEPLTDEQRRERMNSEEFRNRFTPVEQQMMRNMLQVVP